MSPAVLHVAETMQGGVGSMLEELVPAQVEALGRDRVRLLLPATSVRLLPEIPGSRVDVFRDTGSRRANAWSLARAVRRSVRTERPDLVHAHSSVAGVAARLALRGMRRPPRLVYCAHGWAFDRVSATWRNDAIALGERVLARWADAVLCISEHDRRTALAAGLPERRLITIPNGISERPRVSGTPDWPAAGRRVLFVGRFDRQKGADLFVVAMRELGPRAYAHMVGSPVVGDTGLGQIPENVNVTGWLPRERVNAYLASADVVAVPSRWEGFGLAALEAMRASRAVVASRVGGLPELVADGRTGRLVEPGSATALAAALAAPTDDELRSMGRAGRERFEQEFTADRMNQRVLELYERVLARRPPAG